MLKLLGLTGCLCSKAHSKVVHPTPKAESIFHCKECSRTLPTQEQYDNHMCQYHLKSESNTTTPKAGSFDEHHYFEWRREGKEESVVLDRYFIGRMQGDRSPTVTKSVIMEQSSTSSMNLSPTRIDNSPDRFSSKSFLGNEKSEQLIGDPNIIKIVNSIKEQSARTRIKMEAKFIKTYSSKKSSKKFLISESWMEYYGKYLNGEKTEPPGPIDNKELKKRLLLKKTSSGSLYAANESIWFFLRAMYGGGPELCHMNEIPVHKLPKLERMKTDGNDDLGSPIKIRSKPKSLTYSQKPLLADLNYCLRPIKMLKNESSSSVIACFQFLLGVSDLLKCMEQERSINVANLRTSRFVRGFQDVIDAHLKDNKFFLAANLKKIFQDQISDAQYLDAHNFLNIYLNGFMSEFSSNPALSEARSAELKTNTSYLSQTFLSIKSLFGGIVLSTVKCLNCGKKTQTYNECLSLSLPIIHKTTKTIDDCLNLFQKETQNESLHYCERCKSESRTMEQSLVSTFPKYLIVHLDRFEEGTNKKKEDLVNYLAENWKVKGSSEKETSNYSLAGVITHNGPLDSGHYTCLTKRGEEWYMCDDEEVKKVQSKKSIVKDAYILLYQRMN